MQTQTHFLITAALGHLGQRRAAHAAHTPALLIGSVLPDVPFALLTVLLPRSFLKSSRNTPTYTVLPGILGLTQVCTSVHSWTGMPAT